MQVNMVKTFIDSNTLGAKSKFDMYKVMSVDRN